MINRNNIPNISTHRLLKFYQLYRYNNDEECVELTELVKQELGKREHIVTKGRKHEKKKIKQQYIKNRKAKRQRKFYNE